MVLTQWETLYGLFFFAFFEIPLLNLKVFVYNVDIWTLKIDY